MTSENSTLMNSTVAEPSTGADTMVIVHSIIASVGIVTNLTVVIVFMNHKKLKHKIPNICIINQVSFFFLAFDVVLREQ